MANYKEDIVSIDLENGNIHRNFLHHSIGAADENANRFGFRAFRNNVPENLTGRCVGYFIRSDGGTVYINNGVVSGNMAYITLTDECYALEGVFSLAIKMTGGGITGTMRIVDGVVSRTTTGAIVDPGTIIPSIQDLINAIQEAEASIPEDYTQLTNEVRFLEHDPFMPGENLYNVLSNKNGVVIKTDGTVNDEPLGYTSDFIEVFENTEYYKRYVFGSSAVANVAFYDEDHGFLSTQYGSSHTFTTPNDCKYIKICGYLTEAASECIYRGSSFDEHRFYRNVLSPSAGGGDYAYLFATFPIVFDSENNEIVLVNATQGTNNIYLHIPGLGSKAFSFPIEVTGTGSYLFYDLESESFIRGMNEHTGDRKLYLISTLMNKRTLNLNADTNDLFITAQHPVLIVDKAANKLHVNIPDLTYMWYKSQFKAMTAESYDLTLGENVNCVFFNIVTKKFSVTQNFGSHENDPHYIIIGVIYKAFIDLVIPYSKQDTDENLHHKKLLTYGDSLTWYDGNAFTWGPHQGETCIGYQSYLRKYLGAEIDNQGASGSSTPQIVANQIMTQSAKIAANDYIILMPSIMNDDRLEVSPGTVQPIGGSFDDTTTAGALQKAIEYIYTIKPEIRIVMIVEPMGWTFRNGVPELCDDTLPTVIRNVAKLYGLPIIDLWNESGINEITRDTFLADPPFGANNQLYMYHPNNDGWKVISRIICEEMAKY